MSKQKHFNPMAQEPEKEEEDKPSSYVSKEVDFLDKSDMAVFVEWWDEKRRRTAWIARSCLRYDCEKLIDTLKYGSKFMLVCFEWVARKKGLMK